MVIDVHHNRLSEMSNTLQQQSVQSIINLRNRYQVFLESQLPIAGESKDLMVFRQKLFTSSQQESEVFQKTIDSYAQGLRSIANNYSQAQSNAIERALLLR